jgi:HTH-type transcriptional regulator, transcriptional repressor of NAD biosynthesis genes
MAKQMAEHYQTEYVPEVAKELITSNNFTADDIIRIGHAQTNRVKEKIKTAKRFLFCDTDLITTQIYSRHYLGVVPPVLYELEKEIHYDCYFLFDIDVAWVSDGLRDLGHRREEMMQVFKSALNSRKLPFVLVCGNWEERLTIIRKELDQMAASG